MLDAHALDVLFREAHSTHAFTEPVTDEQLRELYELMKWGPTTFNTQPARFVFVRSKEAKEKLAPALTPANLDKTMQAPVTAIVAYDLRFYDNLPKAFPHRPEANKAFMGDEKLAHAERTALRNSSLQGAYMIIAARALGLDCGPMSGFDNAKVDAAFFPDGRWKSNFLCNLGRGDATKVIPRNPRLTFEEACRIV
jgi:3-hydroxypropanoate dehydrogenase